MGLTALTTVFISQFKKMKVRGNVAWIVSGATGSDCGASKTSKGGFSAVGVKVLEVFIWDEGYDGGDINFFEDVYEYLSIRESLEAGTDRIFLSINHKTTHRLDLFKRQNLVKNTYTSALKITCLAESIHVCPFRVLGIITG